MTVSLRPEVQDDDVVDVQDRSAEDVQQHPREVHGPSALYEPPAKKSKNGAGEAEQTKEDLNVDSNPYPKTYASPAQEGGR